MCSNSKPPVFLFSKLMNQKSPFFSPELRHKGTVHDRLFEEGVNFFDIFGHIYSDCIFGSAAGRAQFRIESNLFEVVSTRPGTTGMFMIWQNFSLRGWLL